MSGNNQADFFCNQRFINDLVIFRDSLQFDRLLPLWHDDRFM